MVIDIEGSFCIKYSLKVRMEGFSLGIGGAAAAAAVMGC